MPHSPPDTSAVTARRLRALLLQAMGATTANDAPGAINVTALLRWLVVDVPSVHGEFRQLFDIALREAEALVRAGDMAAATATLEGLRRLVVELEQSLEVSRGHAPA